MGKVQRDCQVRNRAIYSVMLAGAFAWSIPAQAAKFEIPLFGENIDTVSNTSVIIGAAVRTEPQNASSIGKNNLNPSVCGRTDPNVSYYQDCQGLFTGQSFAAAHLTAAPGSFSTNFDHGDLNYKQWDFTQTLLRVNQDITLQIGDWSLFAKGIAFYDPTNFSFNENHPNEITRDNYQQVGYATTIGSVALPVLGARTDSTPCPANRNPTGLPCGVVYGPGGQVKSRRADAQGLHEIGLGFQLLDLNLSGVVKVSR